MVFLNKVNNYETIQTSEIKIDFLMCKNISLCIEGKDKSDACWEV